jgi:Helix-turn-helix domain
MTDKVIDKAWSDIQLGDFMRWATPRFVKYGRVVKRDGNGMTLQFIEDANVQVIPTAKWYFVQGKLNPDSEEHLVCIDYSEWFNAPYSEPFIPPAEYADEVWIHVFQVAEMLRWDEKEIRRKIRRGIIPAHKKDGRWVIHRERLRDIAAKHGWL